MEKRGEVPFLTGVVTTKKGVRFISSEIEPDPFCFSELSRMTAQYPRRTFSVSYMSPLIKGQHQLLDLFSREDALRGADQPT